MKTLIALTILCISALAFSQERITLDSPILATTGVTRFRVNELRIVRMPPSVSVKLYEVDGAGAFTGTRTADFSYEGAIAVTMIQGLNTANLSVKSLERRIIERLQADGKLGIAMLMLPALVLIAWDMFTGASQ